MSKVTDNSHVEQKLKVRQEVVDLTQGEVNVLDCYAGKGIMWRVLKERNPDRVINVLQIEKIPEKNKEALEGDNLKYLKSINLSKFNVIDLDAYGIPAAQMQMLYDRGFKGHVCVTAIQSNMGRLPKVLLKKSGITQDMLSKCLTIYNPLFVKYLKNFLYLCKIKEIKGYFNDDRKNYFYYRQG